MAGKIVTILGLLGVGIGLVTLLSAALAPELSDGSASYRESVPVIAIGGGCSCFSFLVLTVGVAILLLAGRKKDAAPKE